MVWVVGSGSSLEEYVRKSLTSKGISVAVSNSVIDISDIALLRFFSCNKKISFIVNCVSYEGYDSAQAYQKNDLGVGNLVKLATELDVPLLHITKGILFGGTPEEPVTESTVTIPSGIDCISKFTGELNICSSLVKYFILRTSLLFGYREGVPCYLNNVNRAICEGHVDHFLCSPTWEADLADDIASIIDSESTAYGVYNYAKGGFCTESDFISKLCVAISGNSLIFHGEHMIKDRIGSHLPSYSCCLDTSKFERTFDTVPSELSWAIVEFSKSLSQPEENTYQYTREDIESLLLYLKSHLDDKAIVNLISDKYFDVDNYYEAFKSYKRYPLSLEYSHDRYYNSVYVVRGRIGKVLSASKRSLPLIMNDDDDIVRKVVSWRFSRDI